MTSKLVTFRVWRSNTLVDSQTCSSNTGNVFDAPALPNSTERATILGISPSDELVKQQDDIRSLLNSMAEAAVQVNTVLTDLMAQHASASSSKPDTTEDYSSGEDAGDPNESTTRKFT